MARVAGLLAVAVIPVAAGISGDDYLVPSSFDDGFRHRHPDLLGPCILGGVLAGVTVRPAREALREPALETPIPRASTARHRRSPAHAPLAR